MNVAIILVLVLVISLLGIIDNEVINDIIKYFKEKF